jgi:hypothetical protein
MENGKLKLQKEVVSEKKVHRVPNEFYYCWTCGGDQRFIGDCKCNQKVNRDVAR